MAALRWIRACVYCGAHEDGNEQGRCKDGFRHCFQFDWSAYIAKGNQEAAR